MTRRNACVGELVTPSCVRVYHPVMPNASYYSLGLPGDCGEHSLNSVDARFHRQVALIVRAARGTHSVTDLLGATAEPQCGLGNTFGVPRRATDACLGIVNHAGRVPAHPHNYGASSCQVS